MRRALAAGVVLLAAGCGGARMLTATQTVTVTRTVTRTVTQAAPEAGACTASDLTGTFAVLEGSAGAGSISYTLTLTNASQTACYVAGVPQVELLDARGGALPTNVSPQQAGGQASARAVLPPGASASADARFSPDVPGVGEQHPGQCEPTAALLRVTATGGGTLDVQVAPPTPVCSHGAIQLTPLATAG